MFYRYKKTNPSPTKLEQWKMEIAIKAAKAAIDQEMAQNRASVIEKRNRELEKVREDVV